MDRGRITKLGLRIGPALSTMGTLVWFLWPNAHWTPEPEPLLAFFVATVVWLFGKWKIASDKNASHPNDIRLHQKFNALIDARSKKFLREHDLGGAFRNQSMEPFYDLENDWKGADFEFHDPKIQEEFEKVLNVNRKFCLLIAHNSDEVRQGWTSLVPAHERGVFWSDQTAGRIKKINASATELVEHIDNFERTCRARMPDAYA